MVALLESQIWVVFAVCPCACIDGGKDKQMVRMEKELERRRKVCVVGKYIVGGGNGGGEFLWGLREGTRVEGVS